MGSPTELAAAALEYAGYGWRVVPLHPRDKRPRPNDWVKVATHEIIDVGRWWQQVPDGNVGVALGSGSGLVGIDVDTDEGARLLTEMAGPEGITPTLEMTTGKGSRLLYAIPEQLETEPRTRVVRGADGTEALRFQGTGGQCVMPPSVHPNGRLYRWVEGRGPHGEDGIAVASMPSWLRAEMCRPERAEPEGRPATPYDADAPWAKLNREGWDKWLVNWGYTSFTARDSVHYYTRPGKETGVSVSVGHYRAQDGTPALFVFSGNCPHLTGWKCYDLFGAYSRIVHDGNFSAAARRLLDEGYGSRAARVTLEERVRRLEEAMERLLGERRGDRAVRNGHG